MSIKVSLLMNVMLLRGSEEISSLIVVDLLLLIRHLFSESLRPIDSSIPFSWKTCMTGRKGSTISGMAVAADESRGARLSLPGNPFPHTHSLRR